MGGSYNGGYPDIIAGKFISWTIPWTWMMTRGTRVSGWHFCWNIPSHCHWKYHWDCIGKNHIIGIGIVQLHLLETSGKVLGILSGLSVYPSLWKGKIFRGIWISFFFLGCKWDINKYSQYFHLGSEWDIMRQNYLPSFVSSIHPNDSHSVFFFWG